MQGVHLIWGPLNTHFTVIDMNKGVDVNCQNLPIIGYTSSWYTEVSYLKQFLQALPLSSQTSPLFFTCSLFLSTPLTESLVQANY